MNNSSCKAVESEVNIHQASSIRDLCVKKGLELTREEHLNLLLFLVNRRREGSLIRAAHVAMESKFPVKVPRKVIQNDMFHFVRSLKPIGDKIDSALRQLVISADRSTKFAEDLLNDYEDPSLTLDLDFETAMQNLKAELDVDNNVEHSYLIKSIKQVVSGVFKKIYPLISPDGIISNDGTTKLYEVFNESFVRIKEPVFYYEACDEVLSTLKHEAEGVDTFARLEFLFRVIEDISQVVSYTDLTTQLIVILSEAMYNFEEPSKSASSIKSSTIFGD